ncbi:ATP-dependent DNA helicase RecG [Pararhizobium mangrovi]|uniref:ATP-dependent DNA helicase RecG n=1 Tax=Pararhizobium mangrovi TaxID=2590452 RepID=A0A506UFA7_9HYPH|nr:ATP-dependent DNA helicase RecG [Pararhizobium mangrovi]TPW31921.1 ATP-dependent DNA helicase RecG [Pararhizobium mangrovi]
MRPTVLDPLFAEVTALPGVGTKVATLIARVAGRQDAEATRVIDVLFLSPHSVIDRTRRAGITVAAPGTIATLAVRVDRHQPPPPERRSMPYRVFVHDETGEMALTFFRAKPGWLDKVLPVGAEMLVSGKIEWFNGRAQMVHPDHMVPLEAADTLPVIEPVYPLTAGLSGKVLEKAVTAALERTPDLGEWLDGPMKRRERFASFRDALEALHRPEGAADLEATTPARRRLAYDELLAGQLSLALVRRRTRRLPGEPVHPSGTAQAAIRKALPFALTAGQEEAVAAVLADMGKSQRMLRLLQGDVGSGKTVVAAFAMAAVAESHGQSVLMAPTELLARQHHGTLSAMLAPAGIEVALLTGRMKARERQTVLARIASGDAQVVIGTHAVFQDDVAYANLVLAVIDEQHRFGVHQRLQLTGKGTAPHMLVMTATPIPRTLVLAAFGDMDVSKLTEKPAGRKPIATVTVGAERYEEIVERLRNALADGRKAYWICPLVEETDASDLMSAEQRFESLDPLFGDRLGLVHGRMTSAEKDEAMASFKAGDTRLLIATTVIEVGVDVPDATILVIEHAERFGLAQLHQLRGRVGRGSEASSCILLYSAPLGEVAKARLSIMRESEDGFRIAEEDLRLRGEGELLGTRQSGMANFRFAALEHHGDLLETARNDARFVLESDPELTGERGEALRTLLYLFRRDEAIRYLRAG